MNTILSSVLSLLPDKLYLDLQFYYNFHRFPNWESPKTFSEKLQWLKLYDRKPEYVTMVDKYAVKKYVAEKIGEEYVIPTLGVWDKAEDIDWDSLPDKFVLKTTHGGGNTGVVICKDKKILDKAATIEKLSEGLKHDSFLYGREWPYKHVPKRIIAEQLLKTKPDVKDIPDYKWYCFNGNPKFCQVIQDRSRNETIDFFDTEWHHQEFVGLNPVAGPVAGPAAVEPNRPDNLKTQIEIARELSKGIPFSRIDLYETESGTYFGEITFYPMSGLGVFSPKKYNELFGEMLVLPGKKGGTR